MATKGKNTNDADQTNPSITDPSTKIEAIKNLIFGENIQEYNSEFDNIKNDILAKKQALENLIEEVRSELIQNIDNLSTDLNIRITELESNIENNLDDLNEKKVDRRQLGQLLINLGEKIGKE
ncbi:fructose 1,6-bisphosphatase [Kordia sp.]|uniref:fructose 1,6-bisphosphatase n=1 Tax=Kordia sp. TaxID=1965332 RepID=UPI0025BF8846|nr:fructose 1,6-bisphosphatase [Kordia sp.]MCH2192659.1 fructose 1,6-bisphosphatase [Kordia sp.]